MLKLNKTRRGRKPSFDILKQLGGWKMDNKEKQERIKEIIFERRMKPIKQEKGATPSLSDKHEHDQTSDKEVANKKAASDEEINNNENKFNDDENIINDEDLEEADSDDENDGGDLEDYDEEALEDSEDTDKDEQEDIQDDGESKGNPSSQDNSGALTQGADRRNLQPNRGAEEGASLPSEQGTPELDGDSGESGAVGKAMSSMANKIPGGEKVKQAEKVIRNTQKVAEMTGTAITNFISIIMNPISWIVAGLILIIAIAFSTNSTIGQNDYNIMCDSFGVGEISVESDADAFTRQSAIVSWLTSTPFELNNGRPLTKEQAFGIMGNMMSESYGANPKAIQGDSTTTQWQTCDNNCVKSWGLIGGKAVGIIQWDTGRRISLVNFAEKEGTQWHDLTTQLKFLRTEMDSGYENQQLKAGGFNQVGKSIAEYTKIWNKRFERSAQAGTAAGDNPRIANAEKFAASYKGGGSISSSSLSSNCIGSGGVGGNLNTSNIAELAISVSYPTRSVAKGTCVGLVDCGQAFATDAYKQAKIIAEQASSADPIKGLLASCDRFVATILRATGADTSFPWGATGAQLAYMQGSPNWKQVSCQERQPGDVLWRDGHVMMYVGMVNGKDSIASASISERTASISEMSCQGDKYIADDGANIGFRKVN